AALERAAIAWLASIAGYAKGAQGILTTGGSMSNLVAVVTARAAKLGDDFGKGTIYVSDQTHQSVAKAARIAGFSAARVRVIPTCARFRMDVDAFERAVRDDRARGLQPFLVVPSIGTTNTGAIDPLPEVLEIAA